MKGTRTFPQCGFSASVVEILDEYLPDGYETFNVLADQGVREGIKEYSDWPTIPQLYIKGEFVGGRDIVAQMHESGELTGLLGQGPVEVGPPGITITDAAAGAFKDAQQDEEFKDLRLTVTGQFQYGLSFGPAHDGDIVEQAGGLTVRMDRGTARRAQGMTIDFVSGKDGTGFKIDNPNEPPKVKQLGPAELKQKLDDGAVTHLYDVRTPAERGMAVIEPSVLLDEDAAAALGALDKKTPIAFYCHSGARSQAAAQHFLQQGFSEVYNLAGGIDAWSQIVDDSVPRY